MISSQILANAHEADDSQRYDRLFLEAMIEREKGNDAAAFEMLRHCLDISPEASEAYYFLAHYYLRMKDNAKALAAFQRHRSWSRIMSTTLRHSHRCICRARI